MSLPTTSLGWFSFTLDAVLSAVLAWFITGDIID